MNTALVPRDMREAKVICHRCARHVDEIEVDYDLVQRRVSYSVRCHGAEEKFGIDIRDVKCSRITVVPLYYAFRQPEQIR